MAETTGSVIPQIPTFTLRDYFAIRALASVINAQPLRAVTTEKDGEHCVKEAYAWADLMLAQRDK